jgi:hypothetical protein
VQIIGDLAGGVMAFDRGDDIGTIKSRMLSQEGKDEARGTAR